MKRTWTGRLVVAGGLLVGALVAPTAAAPVGADPGVDGTLATAWADDGTAVVNSGPLIEGVDRPAGMVVDSAGRTIVAITSYQPGTDDDIRILRFGSDGALDPTHGSGGVASLELADRYEKPVALALSGDLVVLGAMSDDQSSSDGGEPLVALLDDGVAVAGFGDDGLARVDLGPGPDVLTDVEVDSLGRIVVAGLHGEFPERQPSLLRLNPDGSVDDTFGSDGLVLVETSGPTARSATIVAAIGADDSVSVAGMTTPGGWTIFVGRFDQDGQADETVGGDGTALLEGTGNKRVTGLELDSTGRFHVSGGQSIQAGPTAFVARADADGVLDTGFSVDGFVEFGAPTTGDLASDLAVLAGGAVLVAASGALTGGGAYLARFDSTGLLDLDFGDAGIAPGADTSGSEVADEVVLAGERALVSTTAWVSRGADVRLHAMSLASGDPDPSWGGTGSVSTNTNEIGLFDGFGAMDVNAAGHAVLAGSSSGGNRLLFAKLDGAGQRDPSFADDGLLIDAGSEGDFTADVVLGQDGRVTAVGGAADGEALIVRLTASGEPDPTLAGSGRVVTTFGTGEPAYLTAVVPEVDGHLLTAGVLGEVGFVARFTAAGALDTDFGTGGLTLIDADPVDGDEIHDLAVTPDGRILAAGGIGDLTISRLLPDGSLDGSFGQSGSATIDTGPAAERANAVATADGRILVAGGSFADDASSGTGVLAAITEDGTLDPGFNGGSPLEVAHPGEIVDLTDVAIDGDRILTSGARFNWDIGEQSGTVAAYSMAGAPVTDFATDGTFESEGTFVDLELERGAAALYAGGQLGRDLHAVKLDLTGAVDAPTIRPGVASIAEGDVGTSTIEVPVTLSTPSAATVTVDYQTSGSGLGIAEAGPDYDAATGTVTFAPGDTTETVTIQVHGDRIDEPPALYGEWIVIAFSNPSPGATLDLGFYGLGIGVIVDDDPTPTISPGVAGVVEGDEGDVTVEVPVTLSNPSAVPITVDWTTQDSPTPGVATSGSDHTAASGTVTFAPGQTTATITLSVLGDVVAEPPLYGGEWLLVAFSNASASGRLDTSFFGLGLVVIFDDD